MTDTLTIPDSAASARPRFSVVVPCYNEADAIVSLIEEILAATKMRGDFELIIVDDCSSDITKTVLTAHRDSIDGDFRIVAHSQNCGQSAAICSGVDAAKGDWIVTLDGDGQNDPQDILSLLDVLEDMQEKRPGESAKLMLCGHRVNRRDSGLRRFSSRFANGVRSRVLGDGTPDTGCGLKLFSRAAFLRLPRFDHMHRFLPALIARDGGQAISVPVNHRPRVAGVSKYGVRNRLWVGIVDMCGVLWLKRRRFNATNNEEI